MKIAVIPEVHAAPNLGRAPGTLCSSGPFTARGPTNLENFEPAEDDGFEYQLCPYPDCDGDVVMDGIGTKFV